MVLDYDESLQDQTDTLGLVDQDVHVAYVNRIVVTEVIAYAKYQSLVASMNDEWRGIYEDINTHTTQTQMLMPTAQFSRCICQEA